MPNHYTYRIEWDTDDQIYIGRCLEFPSLAAHGKTSKQAIEEIESVVDFVVEDMKKGGEEVPEPITGRSYSGEFRVRLPRELHRTLAIESAEQDTSLNQLIVSRLSAETSRTLAPRKRRTSSNPSGRTTAKRSRKRVA